MATDLPDGWRLDEWDDFFPMLFGPRNVCVEISDDDLVVSEMDEGARFVHIPRAAVEALIAARERFDERAAKQEGGR